MHLNLPFTCLQLCLHLQIFSGQWKRCNFSSQRRACSSRKQDYVKGTELILHTSVHPNSFQWSSFFWTPWGSPEGMEHKTTYFQSLLWNWFEYFTNVKRWPLLFCESRVADFFVRSFTNSWSVFSGKEDIWTEFTNFQTLFYFKCLCNLITHRKKGIFQ